MKLTDKNYTYSEIKEVLKTDEFALFQLAAVSISRPESFRPFIRQMIQNEDLDVFQFMARNELVFNQYKKLPDAKENIWVEMLEKGKIGFMEKILKENQRGRLFNLSILSDMHKAIDESFAKIDDPHQKAHLNKVRENIEQTQRFWTQVSIQNPMVTEINKNGKTDKDGKLPDLMISTFNHEAYLFHNLNEKDVKDGHLKDHLKHLITKKTLQVIDDSITLEERNKQLEKIIEENDGNDAKIFAALDDVPQSSDEAVDQCHAIMKDLNDFYKTEFDQVDKLYDLCKSFQESDKKDLFQSFTDRGGRIVLQKDEGQNIDFMTKSLAISIKKVTPANLYAALINESETEKKLLSNSPFFRRVAEYFRQKEPDAPKDESILAIFAKREVENAGKIPPYMRQSLRVAHMIIKEFKALKSNDPIIAKKAFVRLQALHNNLMKKDVLLTQSALEKHLNHILGEDNSAIRRHNRFGRNSSR